MARKKAPENTLDVTVFVPRGRVREGEILKAALMAVADQLPPAAMRVKPTVASASEPRTDSNGIEGRDYVVTITWEPRATSRPSNLADEDEKPEPTVDDVLASLDPLTAERLAAATSERGELA